MAIDKMVDPTGYEIKKFGDLDAPSQKAIIWYMANDGEAWELLGAVGKQKARDYKGLHRAVEQELALYVAEHGDVPFGVASIPAEQMKAAWLQDMQQEELPFRTWEEYQASSGPSVRHPQQGRWPGILSSFADEVLQDGWHRCRGYLDAGHADIPVVFYPEERHLIAGAAGPVAPVVEVARVGTRISFNKQDSHMRQDMIAAIESNDPECVRSLIAAGYDDAVKHWLSDTAIHLAARKGSAEMCVLLLDSGASVDAKGAEGQAPIRDAVGSGDIATVRVFLDAGATLNTADVGGGPLHAAAQHGRADIAAALITAGADLQGVDAAGESPLHYAARRGDDVMCTLLLEAGADANASDLELDSPLHVAAQAGCASTCALLIRHGADVRKDGLIGMPSASTGIASRNLVNPGVRVNSAAAQRVLEKVRCAGPHHVVRGAAAMYLTQFQHAVKRGDVEFVRGVLADEPDIDLTMKTLNGRGLLELCGHVGALRHLLLSTMTSHDIDSALGKAREVEGGDCSAQRKKSSPSPI